jgi:acetyltransferase-like isoleucine patch superfamily enzyme
MMNKLHRLLRYDLPLHLVLFLTNFLPDNTPFLALRGRLVGLFLGSCGVHFELGRNVNFYNPSRIHLGNNVYIAYGCVLLAIGDITLGDEVMLAPYVVISAANHTRRAGSYRFGDSEILPIEIGVGSWVGAHVTIMPGASIGRGSLVASNAAVLRGVYPPDALLAGVPAQVKKTLSG